MATTLKVLISLAVVMQVSAEASLPELMRICRDKHVERLNDCFMSAIMTIRPQMAKGIPELNLPPMDPHAMAPVEFVRSEGSVRVRVVYDQLIIHGVSKVEMKYFDWHFKQKKLFMAGVFPSLLIKGRYNISGSIFSLPIEGNGAYTSLLQGVAVESESNLGERSDGKQYLKDFSLDFNVQSSQSKMDNLFGGNRILSETMEHFLKENDELIMQELRPALQKQWGDLLGSILIAFVDAFPPDVTADIENDNIHDRHRKRTNEIQAQRNRTLG